MVLEFDTARKTRWSAVADLHHAFFTGLVLYVTTRRSQSLAAELVFRVFRRQHHERFLPGLAKLGLEGLPPAVAAAQYHYLSNLIGGVRVEFIPESDRKAWIRYAPPRWLWEGTALCGVTTEVSAAMLRGWHAQNGVSLGVRNLAFVCTKQAVDGQDGLEGYYAQFDRDLEPSERLQFARHEEAPDFDPDAAPRLPTETWPRERLEKAHRNYAMEYARTSMLECLHLFGPEEGGHVLRIVGRLVGMQYFERTAAIFADGSTDGGFAAFLVELIAAQGDRVTGPNGAGPVHQTTWTLMRDAPDRHACCALGMQGLVEGMLSAFDRRARLEAEVAPDVADGFVWRIHGKAR